MSLFVEFKYRGDKMGSKKVAIKFKYYRVKRIINENRTENYDLQKFIQLVQAKEKPELKKFINGTSGRIEKIINNENFYGLNFIRMDSISNEYKIKDNGEAEHIDLEDEEYIGKNTVAMYDSLNHVLMIQSNRGGFTDAAIQNYINSWEEELRTRIVLTPLVNNVDRNAIRRNAIRRLEIAIEDVSLCSPRHSVNFMGINNSMKNIGNKTAYIKLGVGKAKNLKLDDDEVLNIYDDVVENSNAIKSAKAAIVENGKSSLIDLLENLEHSFIEFTIEERGELKFTDMFNEMIKVYKDSVRKRVQL